LDSHEPGEKADPFMHFVPPYLYELHDPEDGPGSDRLCGKSMLTYESDDTLYWPS
jgi:hypothetical protein